MSGPTLIAPPEGRPPVMQEPTSFSNYNPECNRFYWSPCTGQEDPFNNAQSMSYQQLYQLNANALLPSSWTQAGVPNQLVGPGAPGTVVGAKNDSWYQYAPTPQGFNNFITASGSVRLGLNTKSAMGRLYGIPNLLRTAPPTTLSDTSPWFNDSELRLDLVRNLGCGRAPPGSAGLS